MTVYLWYSAGLVHEKSKMIKEQSMIENEVAQELQAAQVAEYLVQHLDFFEQYPEVLESLSLKRKQEGMLSLKEQQQQRLKQQLQEQKAWIAKLSETTQANDEMFIQYSEVYKQLLAAASFEQAWQAIDKVFIKGFGLTSVKLYLFSGVVEFQGIPEHYFADAEQAKELLNRLQGTDVFLGRLPEEDSEIYFKGVEKTHVQSVALVRLGEEDALGVIAFASDQASHFSPDLAKTFIRQFQHLLTYVFTRGFD